MSEKEAIQNLQARILVLEAVSDAAWEAQATAAPTIENHRLRVALTGAGYGPRLRTLDPCPRVTYAEDLDDDDYHDLSSPHCNPPWPDPHIPNG